MDELGGAGRRPGRKILPFDKSHAEAAGGGVEGDSAAGGAAADNEDVERVDRAATHQRRSLHLSGRHYGSVVGDFGPDGGGDISGAVVGVGDEGVAEAERHHGAGSGEGGGLLRGHLGRSRLHVNDPTANGGRELYKGEGGGLGQPGVYVRIVDYYDHSSHIIIFYKYYPLIFFSFSFFPPFKVTTLNNIKLAQTL